MTVDDIRQIMPPPSSPVEASGTSWRTIEAGLGTALPEDYKSFIEVYGSGRIAGFVWILNPFSKRENINLLNQIPRQLSALRELAEGFGETCPYPLFPAPGGLLPFGITDNGDVLHWLTSGAPSSWNVVVNESRGAQYESYHFDMATFLLRVLTREEHCPVFPSAFPPASLAFEAM